MATLGVELGLVLGYGLAQVERFVIDGRMAVLGLIQWWEAS